MQLMKKRRTNREKQQRRIERGDFCAGDQTQESHSPQETRERDRSEGEVLMTHLYTHII